ncbi:MAG: hypothetical protein EPN57_25440 [Paraburkholderia sp.]|nr:MAG: hypothetical protein EPN57_25440 [Paraburkholderia sp.]
MAEPVIGYRVGDHGKSSENSSSTRSAIGMRRKVIVSITDHPDIRRAFDGFPLMGLSIRYGGSNPAPGSRRRIATVITTLGPGRE